MLQPWYIILWLPMACKTKSKPLSRASRPAPWSQPPTSALPPSTSCFLDILAVILLRENDSGWKINSIQFNSNYNYWKIEKTFEVLYLCQWQTVLKSLSSKKWSFQAPIDVNVQWRRETQGQQPAKHEWTRKSSSKQAAWQGNGF